MLLWMDEDVSRQAKNTKMLTKNYLKAKGITRLSTGVIIMRRSLAKVFHMVAEKWLDTGINKCNVFFTESWPTKRDTGLHSLSPLISETTSRVPQIV